MMNPGILIVVAMNSEEKEEKRRNPGKNKKDCSGTKNWNETGKEISETVKKKKKDSCEQKEPGMNLLS